MASDALRAHDCALVKGEPTWAASIARRFELSLREMPNLPDEENFSRWVYDVLGTGTMTSESVSAALAIAWYCREPMRCAKLCANLGGDTDTIGAMATAICGAAVGLDGFDQDTVRYLEETNGLDFRAMAERIVALRGEFRLGDA